LPFLSPVSLVSFLPTSSLGELRNLTFNAFHFPVLSFLSSDVRGRVEILKSYLSGLVVSPTVDVSTIARGTPGMSGADLQNLVNQAAVKASREGAKWVDLHDFEWAKDRYVSSSL